MVSWWNSADPDLMLQNTHLIRISTVCKQFNYFSHRISKSHSLTFLKLKLESSNIQCGGIHSVYNGLKWDSLTVLIFYFSYIKRWSTFNMPGKNFSRQCIKIVFPFFPENIARENKGNKINLSSTELVWRLMVNKMPNPTSGGIRKPSLSSVY